MPASNVQQYKLSKRRTIGNPAEKCPFVTILNCPSVRLRVDPRLDDGIDNRMQPRAFSHLINLLFPSDEKG